MTTQLTTTGRVARRVRVAIVTLVAAVIAIFGSTAPASAQAVQSYASSTVNGMRHSGNTQYYNGNRNFTYNVYFNDAAGDQYCTQLRTRVYVSNGVIDTYNGGSVCGGRAGTLSYTITAPPGTTITKVEIWTVRADGAIRSYTWPIWP